MDRTNKKPLFEFCFEDIEKCEIFTYETQPIEAHYFLLSSGFYIINAGNNKLLHHSNQIKDCIKSSKYSHYIDYYIIRLLLDAIERIEYIKEPVPKKLESILKNPIKFKFQAKEWLENHPDNKNEDDYNNDIYNIYSESISWIEDRQLYSQYLSPIFELFIYSSEDNMINFVWDNRFLESEDINIYSANYGIFSISKEEFFIELQLFNDSFIEIMDQRVNYVINKLYKNKSQYSEILRQEHDDCKNLLSNALKAPAKKTDFDRIFKVIQKVIDI